MSYSFIVTRLHASDFRTCSYGCQAWRMLTYPMQVLGSLHCSDTLEHPFWKKKLATLKGTQQPGQSTQGSRVGGLLFYWKTSIIWILLMLPVGPGLMTNS
jgi:hypothetical protein